MDPLSSPPITTHVGSVVIPDVPPKRHIGRVIAIAVVAVLAIGGVVFAVTRGGDDKPTYSLTASSDASDDATAMSFDLTMEVLGTQIKGEFDVDVARGLTHMSMDMGSSVFGLGGTLEMIVDTPNAATYVSKDFFEGIGIPIETDWVLMDNDFLAEGAGGSVFDASSTGDPLSATGAIDEALKTEDLGFAEVNGIKVKHFRVTFSGEDVLKFNPQIAEIFDQAGAVVPDEIVYEFYIDVDNQVRRISYEIDMGVAEVTGDIIVKSINEPLDIEVPDEADVTDARELM